MLTQARKMVYRARGYCRAELAGERFRCDPYHSGFWRKARGGGWEPETFAVLDAHLDHAHDYLDIGAWIGPTVLYGARKARHVWAFEPDPAAFRALAWNIELNGLENVSAFAAAVSDGVGVARMAGFRGERGDSTTSLLNPAGAAGVDVLTLGWEDFTRSVDLSAVSLVKMDIEGAEFAVLPTLAPWLRKVRPALYLSTHAPLLDAAERSGRLEALADGLAFYGRIRDETGRAVSRAELASDPVRNRFRSFLFSG